MSKPDAIDEAMSIVFDEYIVPELLEKAHRADSLKVGQRLKRAWQIHFGNGAIDVFAFDVIDTLGNRPERWWTTIAGRMLGDHITTHTDVDGTVLRVNTFLSVRQERIPRGERKAFRGRWWVAYNALKARGEAEEWESRKQQRYPDLHSDTRAWVLATYQRLSTRPNNPIPKDHMEIVLHRACAIVRVWREQDRKRDIRAV